MNEEDSLRSRYYELMLHRVHVPTEVVDEEWQTLRTYYSEAHRQYHNLHHLYELCQHLDTFQHLIQDYVVVLLAIFYHDLIYDPMSKTNEEDSAKIFKGHFQSHLSSELLSKVDQYIIETKKHDVTLSPDEDLKLFIDFDLAILGSSNSRYEEYVGQIRQEYSTFDDLSFTKGRLHALEGLVSADGAIYASVTMKELLEKQAKDNMRNEIQRLHESLSALQAST